MIKAVIFDYGNVIGRGKGIYKAISEKTEIDEVDVRENISYLVHLSQTKRIENEKFWYEAGFLLDTDLEPHEESIRREMSLQHIDARVIEILSRIKVKKGLISNFSGAYQEKKIAIDKLFDIVIRSDDVGHRKPSWKIYELMISKLGLKPEECLYIDDEEKYVEIARKKGMKGICYENSGQLEKELKKAGIKL